MIKRNIIKDLEACIDSPEVIILVGPRQVGKTTLLKDIAKQVEKKGKKTRFYNLENPLSSELFSAPLKDVLETLIAKQHCDFLFLDEFHLYKNATKLFKILYDDYDIKVFASGSSALEMHKHLKESLAGRKKVFRIFPLSFREWLSSRTNKKLPISFFKKPSDSPSFEQYLSEFKIWGGMPGLTHVQTDDEKRSLLEEYVSSYINKDVKGLLREEDILTFNKVIKILAQESSQVVSENGLSNELGYSLRQIRKDLTLLDQTYVIRSLRPWFKNPRTELKSQAKSFFYDNGVRHIIVGDFTPYGKREDKGIINETFVFQELQKNSIVGLEIFYWRTRQKHEVDFILKRDKIILPIEVKSSLKKAGISDSMKAFFRAYPKNDKMIVLNESLYEDFEFEGKNIYFRPHYYTDLIINDFFKEKR